MRGGRRRVVAVMGVFALTAGWLPGPLASGPPRSAPGETPHRVIIKAARLIDPQNAAAQRLEGRLAEVFAARNEAAPPPATAPPATPEARPSEQAFLTRNPTMADHRELEQRREAPRTPDETPAEAPLEPRTPPEPPRKPGLLRRILGE